MTPFIAELVIGHTQKGVHKVYDRHTYDDEKRDALIRWDQRLRAIVGSQAPASSRASALKSSC